MKKIICIILLLALTLSCTSCSKEPAVVWGEAAGMTSDTFTTTFNLTHARSICGPDSYNQKILLETAFCTENYLCISLNLTSYTIKDFLIIKGDLRNELKNYKHFDSIARDYPISLESAYTYHENDDGTSTCTLEYLGTNNVAEYGAFTLVLSDDDSITPVIFTLNIENYGKMQTVDVLNRKGDAIGKADISAMYADIYIFPDSIEDSVTFTNNVFIVTTDRKTAAFENVNFGSFGYNITLTFDNLLDVETVDHLLYKG